MNDSQRSIKSQEGRIMIVIVSVSLLPVAASACPLCNTETGQQVRAGIFGNDFWPTLLTVLSPFPVLLILLAAMHFGLPRLTNRSFSHKRS